LQFTIVDIPCCVQERALISDDDPQSAAGHGPGAENVLEIADELFGRASTQMHDFALAHGGFEQEVGVAGGEHQDSDDSHGEAKKHDGVHGGIVADGG
jgi:hypothetical protein